MPWRRPARPIPPTSPHALPDPESVRRAALEASWQRDRRVARRRLAWRWVLWFVARYFLHILAIAVLLLLAGWLLDSYSAAESPAQAKRPPADSEVSALIPVALQAGSPARAWPAPSWIPDSTYMDLPAQERNALPLRLIRRLTMEPEPSQLQHDRPPRQLASQALIPSLKPENWLHSKEP